MAKSTRLRALSPLLPIFLSITFAILIASLILVYKYRSNNLEYIAFSQYRTEQSSEIDNDISILNSEIQKVSKIKTHTTLLQSLTSIATKISSISSKLSLVVEETEKYDIFLISKPNRLDARTYVFVKREVLQQLSNVLNDTQKKMTALNVYIDIERVNRCVNSVSITTRSTSGSKKAVGCQQIGYNLHTYNWSFPNTYLNSLDKYLQDIVKFHKGDKTISSNTIITDRKELIELQTEVIYELEREINQEGSF